MITKFWFVGQIARGEYILLACSIIEFGLTIVEIWHHPSNVRKAKERWSERESNRKQSSDQSLAIFIPWTLKYQEVQILHPYMPQHADHPSQDGGTFKPMDYFLMYVVKFWYKKLMFCVVTSSETLRKIFGSRSRWSTPIWTGYIISYFTVETDWWKSCFWPIYSTPKSLCSLWPVLYSTITDKLHCSCWIQ
jgi:hypothetical protein